MRKFKHWRTCPDSCWGENNVTIGDCLTCLNCMKHESYEPTKTACKKCTHGDFGCSKYIENDNEKDCPHVKFFEDGFKLAVNKASEFIKNHELVNPLVLEQFNKFMEEQL